MTKKGPRSATRPSVVVVNRSSWPEKVFLMSEDTKLGHMQLNPGEGVKLFKKTWPFMTDVTALQIERSFFTGESLDTNPGDKDLSIGLERQETALPKLIAAGIPVSASDLTTHFKAITYLVPLHKGRNNIIFRNTEVIKTKGVPSKATYLNPMSALKILSRSA